MTTATELVAGSGSGFEMPHLEAFVRVRAGLMADPYNPDSLVAEDWANPDRLEILSYLASGGASESRDARREQASGSASLVVPNPAADIRRGDRIESPDGLRVWTVMGFGELDQNPFTGWRPTLVVNLEEVRG